MPTETSFDRGLGFAHDRIVSIGFSGDFIHVWMEGRKGSGRAEGLWWARRFQHIWEAIAQTSVSTDTLLH